MLRAAPAAAPARPSLAWFASMLRLCKPRITGLVVITFLGGLWLAPGDIDRWRAIMTLIGTALLVAAANAFNMYLERDADALMERTRDRPLPRAVVSPEAALMFGAALSCAGVPLVFLGSNLLTGLLGLLASRATSPSTRRSSAYSGAALFVGAVPGALPPLMGWTAVTGRLDAPGLALFAILFLWQIPHFLAIAIYRARRLRARRLQGAAADGVERRHARDHRRVLGGAGRGDDRAGAAARRRSALRGRGGAARRGVHRLGGRRLPARARSGRWARSLFLYSIVYLTLLFVALAIDRTVA